MTGTTAGQDTDSPCIDAGNGTATSNGLHERTTRTDFVFEAGTADLGYHYKPTVYSRGPIFEWHSIYFYSKEMPCEY